VVGVILLLVVVVIHVLRQFAVLAVVMVLVLGLSCCSSL